MDPEEPQKTFHYGFYCIAFLDILGQRRMLRQLPRQPNDDANTRKFLGETAGYVLRLRRHLAECFEGFAKPTPLLAGLPEDAQDRILAARRAVNYRGFSDSLIMSLSFRGDHEQCASMIGVFGCTVACCLLHPLALSYKRPIRGGIDVGPGLDITDDEVYGPALEKAHFLESQKADYPRIVVGDELSRYLDEIERSSATSPTGGLAKQLAIRCKQFLTIDTDGLPMLDFLGEEMAKLTKTEERKRLFQLACNYIGEQKDIARSEGDQEHLSRYSRLEAYFEKRSALWT